MLTNLSKAAQQLQSSRGLKPVLTPSPHSLHYTMQAYIKLLFTEAKFLVLQLIHTPHSEIYCFRNCLGIMLCQHDACLDWCSWPQAFEQKPVPSFANNEVLDRFSFANNEVLDNLSLEVWFPSCIMEIIPVDIPHRAAMWVWWDNACKVGRQVPRWPSLQNQCCVSPRCVISHNLTRGTPTSASISIPF